MTNYFGVYIMSKLKKIIHGDATPDQIKAIDHIGNHGRLLAGHGTKKTKALLVYIYNKKINNVYNLLSLLDGIIHVRFVHLEVCYDNC